MSTATPFSDLSGNQADSGRQTQQDSEDAIARTVEQQTAKHASEVPRNRAAAPSVWESLERHNTARSKKT